MNTQSINYGWKFYKDVKDINELTNLNFKKVSVPHTWNNLDGQDGGSDYFRGTCAYVKTLDINKKDNKEYYLEFKGVNSIATVYVNSKQMVEHRGGFSTFRVNVTDVINSGINEVLVLVNNEANDFVYPQTADFTFFGGIYRDVNLLEVNPSRFDLDYFGSEGVKVTPTVNDKDGKVSLEWFVTNNKETLDLNVEILFEDEVLVNKTVKSNLNKLDLDIKDIVLWDGIKSPKMYEVKFTLLDSETILDSRNIRFGFRTYEVTKDGFFLNGRQYNLHGVSRHQDRLDMGWAITKKEHKEDIELIKEVGANSIRLAHYQHDDYFYDLCDEYGMVVWAEIPYISVHMDNGHDNAIQQMKELVIQQYNHPSICIWGISNEITIGGESESQVKLHHELNDLVKELDKTRPTTLACVTMCDTHSPLTSITDCIAYNHYFGWYIGETKDNGEWLDDFRKEFPNKPIGLSEYGCEANLALHSKDPKKGDYSEEYQAIYHEDMLKTFEERPYLWSVYVWNMFDFAVDQRDEGGVKGRNNKGLVTIDRQIKKDSFYLYKAYWSDEQFVHITSKRYVNRQDKEINVKVYSNCSEVSLYVNNKLVETLKGDKVFNFKVNLRFGKNTIKAVSGDLTDTAVFKKVFKEDKSYQLKKEKKAVQNWFMKDGVKCEFKYPEGKFSIKDKFNTIYGTEEGKKVLLVMITKALEMMSPNGDHDAEKFLKSSRKLIGGMSIERIANFAGDKIPQEMLFNINEELNKIDKPSK